jgi:hypothetical protein
MKKFINLFLLAVMLGFGGTALAEEYPKGCTQPAAHSGQDEPHQQTSDGDQQCHAEENTTGSCSYDSGFDSAELDCKVTTFTGSAISTCSVTLECDGGEAKQCNAVASGNGTLSALIGKDPGDSEVYGRCETSGVETLLTCD